MDVLFVFQNVTLSSHGPLKIVNGVLLYMMTWHKKDAVLRAINRFGFVLIGSVLPNRLFKCCIMCIMAKKINKALMYANSPYLKSFVLPFCEALALESGVFKIICGWNVLAYVCVTIKEVSFISHGMPRLESPGIFMATKFVSKRLVHDLCAVS